MIGNRHPPLLVAWALIVVAGLGWGLGSYPLMDQDEGRNGEVAREMAQSNDYVLPHLNGLPYIDKPVLSFAAAAAVMEILGPTELAARSVPFLATLATALVVGWFGARWYGREAGWVAGIAAAVAPLPLAFSRIVILDSLLALLVTSALLAFYNAIEARVAGRSDRFYTLIAWAAIGLGVLTKGPVALAVPLMVAAPYALWRRASWAVWNPQGPLLMAAMIAPWVWFMEDRLPGYLEYVAITETWQRVSSDELQRTQPWWYFLVIAGVGFFPLVAVGPRPPPAGRRDRLQAGVLFSLACGPPRFLFALPLQTAPVHFAPHARGRPFVGLPVGPGSSLPRRTTMISLAGWGLFGLAMAAAGVGALAGSRVPSALQEVFTLPAFLMAALCLISIIGALLALRRGNGPLLVAALSLPLVALPVVLFPIITVLGELRSERALVTMIRTELPAETEVLGFKTWRPSVSFYLQRPVPILSTDGDELRSNYILRTYSEWAGEDGFLRPAPAGAAGLDRCAQPTVYLVHARRSELQQSLDRTGLEKIWTGPKLHAYFCEPPGRSVNAIEEVTVLPDQNGS